MLPGPRRSAAGWQGHDHSHGIRRHYVDRVSEPNYALRGVSLAGGPAPIKQVYLSLAVGLTALFGINGVGKSRLLGAVQDLAAGVALPGRNSFLHLQVKNVDAAEHRGFLRHVVEAAQSEIVDREEAGAASTAAGRPSLLSFGDLTFQWALDREVELHSGLPSSVAEAGFVSCRPVGVDNAPAWDVYVSCEFRAETPVGEALLLAWAAHRQRRDLREDYRDARKNVEGSEARDGCLRP